MNKNEHDNFAWFSDDIFPDMQYYQHLKLGEGWVPHALASGIHVLFIWPLSEGDDVKEVARNLLAVKKDLQINEPGTFQELAIIDDKGLVQNTRELKRKGIQCLDVTQFIVFAVKYFAKSDELCQVGQMAFQNGNYQLAFSCLNTKGQADPEAQYMLGYMYEHGQGVKQDLEVAQAWYWKAVFQGNASAYAALRAILDEEERILKQKEARIVEEIREFAEKLLNEDDTDAGSD